MGFIPFIDDTILRVFGRFGHRSAALDTFVVGFLNLDLFKGAVVIAILCWPWFDFRSDLRRRRILVIQALLGAASAGLISHVLQSMLARPQSISAASEFVRLFGIPNVGIDWMQPIHSFPSDHAAFFGALATGIFLANRRWGIFAFVWTLVVIDLPGVYAGAHYPSDILAGLVLGGLVTLAMTKPAAMLSEPLLRWEKCTPRRSTLLRSLRCTRWLACSTRSASSAQWSGIRRESSWPSDLPRPMRFPSYALR
jgi:undecaprenyl-diphosphatase